ncbi:MAG: TetR/AcrR family transcriptional regulator [Acidimicrobiia bacterium]|nr:TetR/AcrR family transcriptional regulator [Acidimicrobiia bacterium]
MVATALALIEKEGPDSLTMRRLATDLGVTTTTIYWHVGGRDDLVTEIVRHQSERLADRPIKGRTARQRVMSAARHVWDSALENRAVTSLAYQTGTISLLEHPLELALVRELEAAGVTGAAAADALRSILTTVGGFLLLALRDESTISEDHRGPALWSTSIDLDPATVAALTEAPDLPDLFETTVQAVVDHHVPLEA